MNGVRAVAEHIVILHSGIVAAFVALFRAEPDIALRIGKHIALLRIVPDGKQRIAVFLRVIRADHPAVQNRTCIFTEIGFAVKQIQRLRRDQNAHHWVPVRLSVLLRQRQTATREQQQRSQNGRQKSLFTHRFPPPAVRQISKYRPRRIPDSSRCG